jgi:hypothetical protein
MILKSTRRFSILNAYYQILKYSNWGYKTHFFQKNNYFRRICILYHRYGMSNDVKFIFVCFLLHEMFKYPLWSWFHLYNAPLKLYNSFHSLLNSSFNPRVIYVSWLIVKLIKSMVFWLSRWTKFSSRLCKWH